MLDDSVNEMMKNPAKIWQINILKKKGRYYQGMSEYEAYYLLNELRDEENTEYKKLRERDRRKQITNDQRKIMNILNIKTKKLSKFKADNIIMQKLLRFGKRNTIKDIIDIAENKEPTDGQYKLLKQLGITKRTLKAFDVTKTMAGNIIEELLKIKNKNN